MKRISILITLLFALSLLFGCADSKEALQPDSLVQLTQEIADEEVPEATCDSAIIRISII